MEFKVGLVIFIPIIFGGVAVFFTDVTSARATRPWCQVPQRKHWRFPPPPPPPVSHRKPFSYIPAPQNRVLPGRPHVALYQHENHKGFKYEQFVGNRCYNLPNAINDQASSLDTHGRCVMVCRDRDCSFCKKMKPGSRGHFKLSEIGMDDVITSIKPCDQVYEL